MRRVALRWASNCCFSGLMGAHGSIEEVRATVKCLSEPTVNLRSIRLRPACELHLQSGLRNTGSARGGLLRSPRRGVGRQMERGFAYPHIRNEATSLGVVPT